MATNVEHVSKYQFAAQDGIFFDTNIWMYIFGPYPPGDRRADTYSRALAKIQSAGSKIYIDELIVSEFINAYARLKWNTDGKPHGDFKKFRETSDFKPLAAAIASDTKRILDHCEKIESGFVTLDVAALLSEYAVGASDFNDQVISEMCSTKRLTLVTHDADFRGKNLSILTANRKLLP